MNTDSPRIVVCALYHFVRLDNFKALQAPLLAVMQAQSVKGTILLAHEGINGTVAGTREGIDAVLAWLKQDPRLHDIDHKESFDDEIPFYRSKVKLKNEIVTMGIEGIDPKRKVGTHIEPKDWNVLISDPDVRSMCASTLIRRNTKKLRCFVLAAFGAKNRLPISKSRVFPRSTI